MEAAANLIGTEILMHIDHPGNYLGWLEFPGSYWTGIIVWNQILATHSSYVSICVSLLSQSTFTCEVKSLFKTSVCIYYFFKIYILFLKTLGTYCSMYCVFYMSILASSLCETLSLTSFFAVIHLSFKINIMEETDDFVSPELWERHKFLIFLFLLFFLIFPRPWREIYFTQAWLGDKEIALQTFISFPSMDFLIYF